MNFFAKVGKEIELWDRNDWDEFNQWKLVKLEEMFEKLNAAEEKTDNAIIELENLKKIIDLVRKQIHPEDSSSANKLED